MQAFAGLATVCQSLLLLLREALLLRGKKTLLPRRPWGCCCDGRTARRCRAAAAAAHQQQQQKQQPSVFLALCGFCRDFAASFPSFFAATGGASELRLRSATDASLPRRCCFCLTSGLVARHSRQRAGFLKKTFLLLSCVWAATAEVAAGAVAVTFPETAPLYSPAVAAAAAAPAAAAATGRPCRAQGGNYGCVNALVYFFRAATAAAAAIGGSTFVACRPLSPRLPLVRSGASGDVKSALTGRGRQRVLLGAVLWRGEQKQHQRKELQHEQQEKQRCHPLQGEPWQRQERKWLPRPPPRQRHPHQQEGQAKRVQPQHEETKQKKEQQLERQKQHLQESQQESQQERRQKNENLRQQERQTATNEQQRRQSCGSTDNCSYLLPRAGAPVPAPQHPRSSFSCCCYTCLSKWPRRSMWQDRSTDSELERHRKRAQVEKKRSSRRHTQMQLLAQQQRNNDNSRGYSSCNSTSSGAATSCRRATNSRDSSSGSWSNSRSTGRRRRSSSRDISGNALDRCSVRIRGSNSCGYPRPSDCSRLTSGRVNSDARDCSWVSSSTLRRRNTADGMRSIRDSGNKSRRRSRVPSGFLGCSIPFVKGVVLPTSKGDGSSSCGASFVSPSATTGSSGALAAGRESAASSRCCSAYWRPGSSFPAATSVASQGTATAGKAAICFNWEEYCFTLLCIYGRLAEHAGLHSWGIASHPRVDYRQQQPHHPSLQREQQEPRWLWQQQQREGQVRDSRACGICGEPLPPASTPGAQEEFFLHDLVCRGGGRNTKSAKISAGQLDTAGATNSCASFQAAAALLPERDSSAAGSLSGWDGPSRQPFAPARGACEDDVTAAAALVQDAAAVHKQDAAAVAARNGEYGGRSLLQQRRNAREGSSYVRAPWYRLLKLKLLLVQYLRVQYAGALSSAAAAETQRRGTDSQQSVGAAAASPLPCASLVLSSAGVQGLRAQQLERHHQHADDEQQPRRLQQPEKGEKQRRRQQQDWPQEQQQETQQQQRQQQGGEQQEGRWQQQPRQLHQPRQQEKYQAGECQQQETDLKSRLLQQQRGPLAEESKQQETQTGPEKQLQTDLALTCLASTAPGRRACDTPSQLGAIASPLGTCEGSQTASGFLRSNSEESAPLFSPSTSSSAASSPSGSRCSSSRPPSSPSSLSSSLSSLSPPPPSSWCSFFSSLSSFTSSSPPPLASSVVSSGDCLLTHLVGGGALERPLPFQLLPAAVVREAAYLVTMEDTRMTMQEAVQLLCFRAQQQETEQLEKEQASGVRADIAWLSAEEKHIQQNSSSSAAARTSATGGTAAAAAANKRDAAATATAAAAAPARNAAPAATANAATAAPPAMAGDAVPTAETSPFQVAVDASVSEVTRTGEDYGDRKAEAAATATATDAAAFAGRRYDVRPEAHQTGSTALQSPIEKNWPSSFQDWFASASATPKTAGASQKRNLMDTAGRHLSPVAGGTLALRTESRYPDNYSWPSSAGSTTAGAAPVGVLHQSRMPKRGIDREAWRAELALLQRLQQVKITQQDWMVLLPLLPFHFPFEAFEAKATQEELLQFYSELPRRTPTNARRNGSSSSSLEDRSRHNHTSSSSSYGSACPNSSRSTTADSQAESSIRSTSDGNNSSHEWSTRSLSSNRSGKTALLPVTIGGEGSPPTSAAALLAHHLRETPEESTDPPAPVAAAAAEPVSPSVGCGSLAGGEERATSGHGETVVSTAVEVTGPAAVSRQQVGGVEASRSCSRGEEEQQQRHRESGAAKVTAGAAALQPAPPQQRSRHPVAVEEAAGAAPSLLLRDQQREGRRGFAPLRGSKGDPLQESMAATVDQQQACDLQVDKKSHPVATATPACSGGSKQAGDAEEDLQQQQEEQQRMDHRKKEEEEGGLQQHCQRSKQQKRAAARLTYKEGRIHAVGRGKQRRSWPPLPLLRLFAELVAVLQRRQRERLIDAQVKTLCSIERRDELDTSTSGGKEGPEELSFDEREQVEQFFIKQRKQYGASWQETWIRLLNAAMQQHPFASPAARAAAEDAFLWLAARGEDTGSEAVEEVGEDLREDADRGCSCVRAETGRTQREEEQDGEEGGSLRFLNNERRDEQQAAAAVQDVRIQEDRAGDATREASRRRETAAGTHSEEEVVRDAERKKGEGEGLPEAATGQYAGGRVQAKGDDDPTYRDTVGDAVLLLQAQKDSAHGGREPRRGETKHRIEAAFLRGDKEGNEETNRVKPEESEPLQETGGHSRAKAEVLGEIVEDVREGEEQTQGDASRLTPEATTESRRRAVLQERMGDGRRRRRGGDGEADGGGDGGEGAGALREDSERAEGGAARAARRAQTTHDAKEVQTTEERRRRGRWAVTFGSVQEAVLHAVEGEEERSLPWLEFLYEVSKRRRRSS